MSKYASKVVGQAKAWLGRNEADGTHRLIIDIYNSHTPPARNYAVQYGDAWCAAFVSAVAVKLGYTDIIPTECSCSKMIELLKSIGAWVENDGYTPKAGDLIFYDWDDSGKDDNTNSPDHVGIVETVQNGVITVIEGNYKNAVSRREIAVDGKYIRGYGVPKYDAEHTDQINKANRANKEGYVVNIRYLKKGCEGEDVRALQILLIGRGYSCGKDGADGIFGDNTAQAVRKFQRKRSLEVDAIAGPDTMSALLGV